jgi:hypothetical protein
MRYATLYWMYRKPWVYVQLVYKLSLLQDIQITGNTCFSVFKMLFTFTRSFLQQTTHCTWHPFLAVIGSPSHLKSADCDHDNPQNPTLKNLIV